MPPRKRARSAATAASDAPASLVLEGGHAEKPRTIACYRDSKHCDVEVHASDGTAFHAQMLIPMMIPILMLIRMLMIVPIVIPRQRL